MKTYSCRNALKTVMLGLAAVFPFLAAEQVSHENTGLQGRIFNGEAAQPGQFKSLVAIYFGGYCTGAIISTNIVISAAHCFRNMHHHGRVHSELLRPELRHITIITSVQPKKALEANFEDTEETQRRVVSYMNVIIDRGLADHNHSCDGMFCLQDSTPDCSKLICPQSDPKPCERTECELYSSHDVALVRVDPPFKFNQFVGPIALIGERVFRSFKADCVALGYGRVGEGIENKKTNDLSYVKVKAGGGDFCNSLHERSTFTRRADEGSDINPNEIICTVDDDGKQVCSGDSGSPLICEVNGKQLSLGLLSSSGKYGPIDDEDKGSFCGAKKTVALYVDVGLFNKWIRRQAQDDSITYLMFKDVGITPTSGQVRLKCCCLLWLLLLVTTMNVLDLAFVCAA